MSNLYFSGNSMNNLSSYCGLTDSRMRASEKDLPVLLCRLIHTWQNYVLTLQEFSSLQSFFSAWFKGSLGIWLSMTLLVKIKVNSKLISLQNFYQHIFNFWLIFNHRNWNSRTELTLIWRWKAKIKVLQITNCNRNYFFLWIIKSI